MKRLLRGLPIFGWLREYNAESLRNDILAGMTLAAFTIPEAMAYAGLAGLPPHAGLYASITAPILYVIFGTSRQLAVGPTSAVSVLVASGLASLIVESLDHYYALAAMTAVLMGCMAFAARALKLGFLVNFISHSVLVGFSCGAALYIGSTQLGKLFGIGGAHGQFFERILHIFQHIGEANPWALLTGVGGILVILLGEHWFPRLPWALLVVVAAIAGANSVDMAGRGVHLVGSVPAGLPSVVLPALTLSEVRDLLTVAFAAFVLAYIEGMSMARSYASKHKYRVDADQELLALGFASVGAGLTQAYPIAGSFSRTALNDESGARTPLAGGFSAMLVACVLVFVAGLFSMLPEPILASVVLVAVRGLFKVKSLQSLYHLRRQEFWTAAAALLGVLVFGVLSGVLVGVVLSLLLVIGRASQARLSILGRVPGRLQFADLRQNPENITIPGLCIIRFDECVFYANAEPLRDKILEIVRSYNPPVHSVVLDLEMTSDLDIAGAEMLGAVQDELAAAGVRLRLSRLQPETRELLDRSGITEKIGAENIHLRTIGAVASYLNEEGTHLQEAHDILPDLVKRVQDMVRGRAAHLEGEDQTRLKAVGAKIKEILEILKSRSG